MTTPTRAAITFKHILVATDLSPGSLWSLPYVTAIGRQYGSTIYMGHVIPLLTYAAARPQSYDAIERETRENAGKKIEQFAAEVKEQGVPVKTLLAEGDIGCVLAEWIAEHHIDLVAVGTTGRSGIRKLALGSVAEEIIRDADCPVLTVGPESAHEPPAVIGSILYATDFSQDSSYALPYALSLADRHVARLIVLNVAQQQCDREASRALRQRLSDLIPNGTGRSSAPEVLIGEGNAAEKVLEIAREHAVDLLVIGVRGAGALPRLASHFGSTAHDIVVSASCPVLTVRAPLPEQQA